jgi:hypothetical protein
VASLKVNAGKRKYIFMSCQQNAGQSHNTKKLINHVEMGQHFGTTVTNKNCIHIESKSRINFQGMHTTIQSIFFSVPKPH